MKKIFLLAALAVAIALAILSTPFAPRLANAQTNTFCTSNLTCAVTAPWTFTNMNNVIYGSGYGMKCDSSTDDSTSFTKMLAASRSAKNGHIILPPGTCVINPASGFSIPNNTWISGAGKYTTTLRTPSLNNSTIPSLNINGTAPNNVILSDFGVDGNAQNQTNGGALIQVLSNGGKITIQRMHFLNSWADCIVTLSSGPNFTSDLTITDNDFEVCGHIGSPAMDVRIFQPLRVKVNGNRFNGSLSLASVGFSSNVGVGKVEVADNHFLGGIGFGVALGGGTIGASDGNIHDNFFTMSASANQNVIDISYWTSVTVHHNHILAMGTCCIGISDLPPANKAIIDSNEVFGSPSAITNSGISMGGNDTVISNNFVQGAGGTGIGISVGATSQSKSIVVSSNAVKNNSQASSGSKAGIEVFLATGGTASLTGVIIKGNRSYDDQGSPTQGWGIGLAVAGQTTGYSNFTVEGNDVNGNKTAGMINNATSYSGFTIQNNGGSSVGVTFANLGTPVNGVTTYCSDCTVAIPCAGSGNGALAKRLNGVWVCN